MVDEPIDGWEGGSRVIEVVRNCVFNYKELKATFPIHPKTRIRHCAFKANKQTGIHTVHFMTVIIFEYGQDYFVDWLDI